MLFGRTTMRKYWMIGAAVIAMSAAAALWSPQPVRSSEVLLGKAQSEFATKARDALIRRRMAELPMLPTELSSPPSVPTPPYAVVSLEPVAPATIAAPKESTVPTPVSPATVAESHDAPVAISDLPVLPEFVAVPKTEKKEAAEVQIASLPEPSAAENVVTPKPVPAVAPTPEPARIITPVVAAPAVTPTHATPPAPAKVAHKAHRAPNNESNTNTVVRRSERAALRYSTPYSIETLRAHAPEIAAAIARYL
jgi:hypothetical protein